MASVFQQIVTDKIICTPGGTGARKITRDDANKGLLVELDPDQSRANINVFTSVVVRKTKSTLYPFGVLGDYHNDKTCTIYRKGRILVKATFDTATIFGRQIFGDGASGKEGWASHWHRPDVGVGKIINSGTHSELGVYYIVDLNLPRR